MLLGHPGAVALPESALPAAREEIVAAIRAARRRRLPLEQGQRARRLVLLTELLELECFVPAEEAALIGAERSGATLTEIERYRAAVALAGIRARQVKVLRSSGPGITQEVVRQLERHPLAVGQALEGVQEAVETVTSEERRNSGAWFVSFVFLAVLALKFLTLGSPRPAGVSPFVAFALWFLVSWAIFALAMFVSDRAVRRLRVSSAGRALSRDNATLLMWLVWSFLLVLGMQISWEVLLP